MKDLFESRLARADSLHRVAIETVGVLQEMKNGSGELAYVSGIISSEGISKMSSNIRRLAFYTDHVRRAIAPTPVFSATDVFSDDLYQRIEANQPPKPEDFEKCWRTILSEGGVTVVYFTPRWRVSRGARDEYEAANELGLRTVDIDINHPFLHFFSK